MKAKDEAFDLFKGCKALVANRTENKIKIPRSGIGGSSHLFEKKMGWHMKKTFPYTPQQNGLAERKNKILTEMANAVILNAKLPMNLCGEGLHTACHMHNRIPSRKYKACPYVV